MCNDLVQKVEQQIAGIDWNSIAQQAGFRRRTPKKISPLDLLKALCLLSFSAKGSFDTVATTLGFITGRVVSKQAVAKRTTAACVDFLRQALAAIIRSRLGLPSILQVGVFASFSRVLLQDSTSVSLPSHLAHHFPGSKNQTGKANAVLKIQTVYDILKESFISFTLSGFNVNDQRASPEIMEIVRKGDLIIRDLGYFVTSVLRKIGSSKAFFLSRLQSGVSVLSHDGSERKDLLKQLRRYGSLDISVCIGEKEKFPVRLVAIKVPDAIAAKRRRKARESKDKRSHPSKKRLALLGWEIFVTNVSNDTWSPETVGKVYGVRWRIEIIFKTWKSHFKLSVVPSGSRYQVEVWIYSRLIFLTLFQTMFYHYAQQHSQRTCHPSLSLLKVAPFFIGYFPFILQILSSDLNLQFFEQLVAKHCSYDKRSDRANYIDLLQELS